LSLEIELTPILNTIGRELIAATPETWASAELLLEVTNTSQATEGMAHSISSPEGQRDLVVPTGELMDATFDLLLTCRRHDKSFRALTFTVQSDAEGNWRFNSRWFY
jgi:hypothetical protein